MEKLREQMNILYSIIFFFSLISIYFWKAIEKRLDNVTSNTLAVWLCMGVMN